MVALAHEQAQDHLAEAPLIRQWNLRKRSPTDVGRTEQTIAVSIRIASSSWSGLSTSPRNVPRGRPVVWRVQPSIEMSVIRLVDRIRLSARNCA